VKTKPKVLLSLALAIFALLLMAQPVLAYTYPSSRRSSSSSSTAALIPMGIIAVGFVAYAVALQRQGSKMGFMPTDPKAAGPDGTIKVSEVVKAKLLPGEKPLAQMPSGRADFVATDQRLLRFSSGGSKAVEYGSLSGASYETPKGRRMAAGIVLAVCALVAGGLGIGVFASSFDSSVRNVSVFEGVLMLIFCLALAACCILVAVYQDFGFYQFRARTTGAIAPQEWQIKRHPFARKRVDGFARIVSDRIKAAEVKS